MQGYLRRMEETKEWRAGEGTKASDRGLLIFCVGNIVNRYDKFQHGSCESHSSLTN